MAILVDEAVWTFRDHLWCHLVSDVSLDELHAFAASLELPSRLFHGDHYDLPEVYRADAIAAGATPIGSRELVTRLRAAGLRCTPAERRAIKAAQQQEERPRAGAVTRLVWRTHIGPHDEPFDRLIAHYGEAGRAYHDLSHIDAVLSHVSDLYAAHTQSGQTNLVDLSAVMAAALYHDVIYDATASDNEAASAVLARQDLIDRGWSTDRTDAVAAMIEGTAGHLDPSDDATAILFDADLAILGAEPEHYERYVQAVRVEYAHVSDDAWQVGRPRVLQSYLDRPYLYSTSAAAERWTERAEQNLRTELASLSQVGRWPPHYI